MLRFRSICRLMSRRVSSGGVFRVSKQQPTETPIAGDGVKKGAGTFSRCLKFGSLGTLALTVYATYAYSLRECEQMTRDLRMGSLYYCVFTKKYWEKYMKDVLQYLFPPPKTLHFSESTYRESESTNSECESTYDECESDWGKWESRKYTMGFFNPVVSLLGTVPALLACVYLGCRSVLGGMIKEDLNPLPDKLLPERPPDCRYTLVLDVNGTIASKDRKGKYSKRPGMEDFMRRCLYIGYELVVYTDTYWVFIRKFLDDDMPKDLRRRYHILTKSDNVYQDEKFYRDLSRFTRDPSKIIYVSANALENCLQHENCVPIKTWNNEEDDTELADLLPFLEDLRRMQPKDLRPLLLEYREKGWKGGKPEGKEREERFRTRWNCRRNPNSFTLIK